MTPSTQSDVANLHHAVCDDEGDRLACDPHVGCASLWILPCDGASWAPCGAFTSRLPHSDDIFPRLDANREPYWRRTAAPR